MVPRKWAVALLMTCVMGTWSTPQSEALEIPAPMRPYEEILRQIEEPSGTSVKGLNVLFTSKVKANGVTLMEHLPRGGWAVEVSLSLEGRSFRYPLKVKKVKVQGGSIWRIVWAPSAEFTSRYLAMVTQAKFGTLSGQEPEWAAEVKMPAMPVILTKKEIITPYGALDLSKVRGLDPSLPGAMIAPPAQYARHLSRWLNEHLEGDPAAVSVDLLADGRVSWQDVNRVVFGSAGQGFYKVYLIGKGPGGKLRALESAAPIFGSMPSMKALVPLTVGFFPEATQTPGVRLGYGAMKFPKLTCRPDRNLCPKDHEVFAAELGGVVKGLEGKKPKIALFATTAKTTLGQAMPWLSVMPGATGIKRRRVFIGFVSGGPEK